MDTMATLKEQPAQRLDRCDEGAGRDEGETLRMVLSAVTAEEVSGDEARSYPTPMS